MSGSIHEWDGAYVLGALSPEERHRYEEHLQTCAECAVAVQELAGLPGILGRLDPDDAVALRDTPDDAGLRGDAHLPGRAAGVARRVRSRRRRTRWTAAVVLVAVLVAGSFGGWALVGALQPAAGQTVAVRALTPVGGSHLSASLTVSSVGWGTRFEWSCDYRRPSAEEEGGDSYEPRSYSLVVHTRTGTTSTVATWTSDAGEAKGLVAASAIPADTISSIDIRVTGSSTPLASVTF